MSDQQTSEKSFDLFELCAAVLLGLGAIGAALAGHQSGLWGGQSVEGYGESAAMTTRASTTYNDELTSYIQDAQVDNRAKELIWEALEIDDAARATRLKQIASWLYSAQLSEAAYKTLKLPPLDDDADATASGDASNSSAAPDATDATADASADESAAESDEDAPFTYSDDALSEALNTDLGEEYVDELFGPSQDEFAAAEKRFDEGRKANSIGDQFSLASVILTVALFFGGLSLVFKSRIRWAFFGFGCATFLAGVIYMFTLAWA